MREIEIKLKAKDLGEVEKRLIEKGCVLSESIFQHDTIYSRAGSNQEYASAKEGDIIMRIRRMKDYAQFNLKQQKSSEMDNLEYETKVEDPEAINQILNALGYVPTIEVKKMRRKGKMGEFEVCLDQVEQLGTFVELEKLTDDKADPAAVREELFTVLESIGLSRGDEETRGYDTQIFQLRHTK
jgi:adenylate cyclase, class 2